MTGISEAVAAVKVAYGIARSAKDITDKVKLDTAVSDVLDALGGAQTALLELQQQHFDLIDENRRLKEIISKDERFEQYRLERTAIGDFVMSLKDEHVTEDQPAHVICIRCKESGRVSVMNEDKYWYRCSSCDYMAAIQHRSIPRRGPMF